MPDAKVRYTGTEVQRQVADYCRALGLPVERRNTGAARYANPDGSTRLVRYGIPGDPDLEVTLPDGRVLHVEAKATGELPTMLQFDRIVRLNMVGRVAIWVDSLDTVMRVLPEVLEGAKVRYTSMTVAEVYRP